MYWSKILCGRVLILAAGKLQDQRRNEGVWKVETFTVVVERRLRGSYKNFSVSLMSDLSVKTLHLSGLLTIRRQKYFSIDLHENVQRRFTQSMYKLHYALVSTIYTLSHPLGRSSFNISTLSCCRILEFYTCGGCLGRVYQINAWKLKRFSFQPLWILFHFFQVFYKNRVSSVGANRFWFFSSSIQGQNYGENIL